MKKEMTKAESVKTIEIQEHTIEDLATGLKLRFEAREDGEARVCLSGSILPLGNREYHFDRDGQYVGAGTWLTPLEKLWPFPEYQGVIPSLKSVTHESVTHV